MGSSIPFPFFSKHDFNVYIHSGLLIGSSMSFHEVPVIVVINDAGRGKKTWPFSIILPANYCKLCALQEEQVRSHEARFKTLSTELAELRSYPPDRKLKGRELEEYRHRDEYLEFEVKRGTNRCCSCF